MYQNPYFHKAVSLHKNAKHTRENFHIFQIHPMCLRIIETKIKKMFTTYVHFVRIQNFCSRLSSNAVTRPFSLRYIFHLEIELREEQVTGWGDIESSENRVYAFNEIKDGERKEPRETFLVPWQENVLIPRRQQILLLLLALETRANNFKTRRAVCMYVTFDSRRFTWHGDIALGRLDFSEPRLPS